MLELKNISFEVESESAKQIGIIHDLSLQVEDGKFVVITGPNGGGKSTTARLIAGIETPTSGSIFLDGEDITELNITESAIPRLVELTDKSCFGYQPVTAEDVSAILHRCL